MVGWRSGMPGRAETAARAATAECTSFNLRKASRAVSQYFDAIVQPSGLKGTQFSVLAAVSVHGPVPISRLAEGMVVDRTTLTRNLKPLQSAGLIAVEPGADRRARLVRITAAGRKALARALPLWEQAQSGLIDRLGRQQWQELIDNLRATTTAARR